MLFGALVLAANPYLDEGKRLVDRMHYPESEDVYTSALADDPDLAERSGRSSASCREARF